MLARLLAHSRSSLCLVGLAAPATGQALGEVVAAVTDTQGQGGFSGVLADGDRFGAGLARNGDVDEDGVEDVAIGAPGAGGGGVDRGAVWLLFLNADGTARERAHRRLDARAGGSVTGPRGVRLGRGSAR